MFVMLQILKARLAEAEQRSSKDSSSLNGDAPAKTEDFEKKFKEVKTKLHAAMLERADMQQVISWSTNIHNNWCVQQIEDYADRTRQLTNEVKQALKHRDTAIQVSDECCLRGSHRL